MIHDDLRYAARLFVKDPGFTCAAVLTLGLGIGLNASVFSVVNAVLFRPLPVTAPEELAAIYSSEPGDFLPQAPMASADFEDFAEENSAFTDFFAYTYTPLVVEHGEASRLVLGTRVTPDFFTALGVEAALGRVFAAAEPRPEAPREVVLSHAAWRRRYGADRGVLGAALRVNGEPVTVIGVAPKEFSGLTRGVSPELWVPMTARRALAGRDRHQGRDLRGLWVIGRLAPGTSFAAARAEVRSFAARLAREFPETHRDRTFLVLPAAEVRILPGVDTTLRAGSFVVLGIVALVLLIASANVANLLLARALARRREIATRVSLGARPWTLVGQLLTESLVLAFSGGVLGLLLVLGSNALLTAWRLPIPVDLTLGLALDVRVVSFTFAVAAGTALVFGLAPALGAVRGDLSAALRGVPAGAGRPRRHLASALVVAQVAFSFLLLVAAGLMVRSTQGAHRVALGFDPSGVAVASFAPRLQGYTRAESEDFLRRLNERVRALPGIESTALASHLPLAIDVTFERVAAARRAAAPITEWPNVDSARVGPGYFQTLRIPLRRGRTFTEHDTADSPRVAVVNRSFAERFWPAGTALGRRLRVDRVEGEVEVVGVVADGKYRTLGEAPRPYLYLALAQNRWRLGGGTTNIQTGSETLVARTQGDPHAVLAAVRRTAREIDPTIAIARLETLRETLGLALYLPRLAAVLFGFFGLLGLVLTATGLYGVMAYTTSRRTREIGLRMALGAERRHILLLVVRLGVGLTSLGIVLGLAGAFAATRTLQAVLYGVSATDALTLVGVALFLLAVGLVASFVPARRAAGVDPWVILRYE